MRIFVGGGAADSRFVHAYVFGHILQHQRLQLANAMLKKPVLKLDDRGGDLEIVCWRRKIDFTSQRAERNRSCRYSLVSDWTHLVAEYPLVDVREAQAGYRTLVEGDDKIFANFLDERRQEQYRRVRAAVIAARFRLEQAKWLWPPRQFFERELPVLSLSRG